MKTVLEIVSGDHGAKYAHASIIHALEDSKIISNAGQFKLVSGRALLFNLCPVRVHTSPHKEGGVSIRVVTSPNMTRFGLVVMSYKRCNKEYLYAVSMPMMPIFVADYVRARLAEKLKSLIVKPGFILQEAVCAPEDDNDYDDHNNDNDEDDGHHNHFMNSATKDSIWLAVARPEIYMAVIV
jgi:hypothetical protein